MNYLNEITNEDIDTATNVNTNVSWLNQLPVGTYKFESFTLKPTKDGNILEATHENGNKYLQYLGSKKQFCMYFFNWLGFNTDTLTQYINTKGMGSNQPIVVEVEKYNEDSNNVTSIKYL